MTGAQVVTLPRDVVLDAAAWLLAFEELLFAEERSAASPFGDEWCTVAHRLLDACPGDEPVVDATARGRELAAYVLRSAADGDLGRFTLYGDEFTRDGLLTRADELELLAEHGRAAAHARPEDAAPA